MNKKPLLLSSLLTLGLLTGCNKTATVENGDDPVGNAGVDYQTKLNIQKFYESLKTSTGGEKAMEKLLDRLFELEYATGVATTDGFKNADGTFNVREYRTTEAFKKDINDQFQDIVDGTSYVDENGKFDVKKYVKSLTDNDYEVEEAESGFTSKYLTIEELAGYNFDKYIEEVTIPDLYEKYFYEDYLLGSNKYKGQFANQYGITFEVLKIDNYTTAENSSWTESFIKDIKAITVSTKDYQFSSDYSFVTSNSDGQLIVFDTKSTGLTYSVYTDKEGQNAIETLLTKVFDREAGYEKLTNSLKDVIDIIDEGKKENGTVEMTSWTIDQDTVCDQDFFEKVEEILVARKLYNIDQEVIKASNANQKNQEYQNYTETDKTAADGYLSTYTNSNAYSILEGAKNSKISAQQTEYYTESTAYTKGTYGDVLPSAISGLRGTTARDLQSHLLTVGENGYMERYDATTSLGYSVADGQDVYLLPYKENLTSPVYLDSDYYYIVKVSNWYGYYIGNPQQTKLPYKSLSNYQIEAYQNGFYKNWTLDSNSSKYVEDSTENKTIDNQAMVDLIQTSAESILTSAMRKEAVVELFEKYGLEINDQEVYDYIKSNYPDYFED